MAGWNDFPTSQPAPTSAGWDQFGTSKPPEAPNPWIDALRSVPGALGNKVASYAHLMPVDLARDTVRNAGVAANLVLSHGLGFVSFPEAGQAVQQGAQGIYDASRRLIPTPEDQLQSLAHVINNPTAKGVQETRPAKAFQNPSDNQNVGDELYKPKTVAGRGLTNAIDFAEAPFGGEGTLATRVMSRFAAPVAGATALGEVDPNNPVLKGIGGLLGAVAGGGGTVARNFFNKPSASAEDQAATYLKGVLDRSGASPDTLHAKANEYAGHDITAAEAVGPNAISAQAAFMRRGVQPAGEIRDQLTERTQSMPGAIMDKLAQITGVDPRSAKGAVMDLIDAGRAAAAPLYKKAFQRNTTLGTIPAIQSDLDLAHGALPELQGHVNDTTAALTTAQGNAARATQAVPQLETAFNAASRAAKDADTAVANADRDLTLFRARNPDPNNVYASAQAKPLEDALKAAEDNRDALGQKRDALAAQLQQAHEDVGTHTANLTAAQARAANAQTILGDATAHRNAIADKLRQAQIDAATGANGGLYSPHLARMLQRPNVNKGIQIGLAREADLAAARNEPFNALDYGVTGVGPDGTTQLVRTPTTKLIDVAKRGLDAMINEYRNPTTGVLDTNAADHLIQLRRSLLNEADRLNPDYAAARATSGDYMSMQDAFQRGQKLLLDGKTGDDDFTKVWSRLSPPDQKAMLTGGMHAIFNNADNDKILNGLTFPRFQRKLAVMVGPDAAADVVKYVKQAKELRASGYRMMPNVGSHTAETGFAAADQDGLGGNAAHAAIRGSQAILNLAHRNLPYAILNTIYAAQHAAPNLFRQAPMSPEARDVASRMFAGRPEDLARFLQQPHGVVPPPASPAMPLATSTLLGLKAGSFF